MRIALAQIAPTLGDVDANLEAMAVIVEQASERGADLVVFPELATHGYWLGRVHDNRAIPATDPRLHRLPHGRTDVLVGFHEDAGIRSYNSAAYLGAGGRTVHTHRKLYLPTYLAWEERKHAAPGQQLRAFDTAHGRFATLICADAWQPVLPWLAAQDGAELLLIPANGSDSFGPDRLDPVEHWSQLLQFTARTHQTWVVFVNRVGQEGPSTFWGGSRVVDPDGVTVAEAERHQPELLVVDIDVGLAGRRRRQLPLLAEARLSVIARETRRLIDAGGDA